MPEKLPESPKHLRSVAKAREVLQERALELLEGHLALIGMAAAKGDFESALKASQWLLEHMPAEAGLRLVEASVDKPLQVESGPKGPLIQIGIGLGGVTQPKQLPEPAIDITPTDEP